MLLTKWHRKDEFYDFLEEEVEKLPGYVMKIY